MRSQAAGRRVRIYIGESDQWRGKTLYVAIVQEARKRGLAGATVARGIMGYGAGSVIHEPHIFRLSNDLPEGRRSQGIVGGHSALLLFSVQGRRSRVRSGPDRLSWRSPPERS